MGAGYEHLSYVDRLAIDEGPERVNDSEAAGTIYQARI